MRSFLLLGLAALFGTNAADRWTAISHVHIFDPRAADFLRPFAIAFKSGSMCQNALRQFQDPGFGSWFDDKRPQRNGMQVIRFIARFLFSRLVQGNRRVGKAVAL